MPDRDVRIIRDLIHYHCATIIAKSAFAASDGERRLKHRATRSIMTPSRRFSPLPPQLLRHGRHRRHGWGRGETVLDVDAVIREGRGDKMGGGAYNINIK
jgi:hypothetical protein